MLESQTSFCCGRVECWHGVSPHVAVEKEELPTAASKEEERGKSQAGRSDSSLCFATVAMISVTATVAPRSPKLEPGDDTHTHRHMHIRHTVYFISVPSAHHSAENVLAIHKELRKHVPQPRMRGATYRTSERAPPLYVFTLLGFKALKK